jgi:hypothetical protein
MQAVKVAEAGKFSQTGRGWQAGRSRERQEQVSRGKSRQVI